MTPSATGSSSWFSPGVSSSSPVAVLMRPTSALPTTALVPPPSGRPTPPSRVHSQWNEDQLPWTNRVPDEFAARRSPVDLLAPAAGRAFADAAPAGLDREPDPTAAQEDRDARRRAFRRGVAAVVVTGGTLSMVAGALPQTFGGDLDSLPGSASLASFGTTSTADVPTVLQSSVAPVQATDVPEVLDDVSPLVRAVEMHEAELARAEADRLAAEEAARVEAERQAAIAAAEQEAQERRAAIGADCDLPSGIGAVQSHVREAAQFLGCQYDVETIHGVAGRAGTSDHPSGRALDFMIDRVTGDQLAQCALDNMDALGISYVIWEQQINTGSGWELMEDRGDVTANHFDHVHVSFDGPGNGQPVTC